MKRFIISFVMVVSILLLLSQPALAQTRTIRVSNADGLKTALQNARPGDTIIMADGIYRGNFKSNTNGTAAAPITLVGNRAAILDGGSTSRGYGFYMAHDYWVLDGFTIRNTLKGIMLDGVTNSVLQKLEVYQIGQEGIHFRTYSSDNILQHSWIHDTGIGRASWGEGIYIGTAVSNWGSYTGGQPDSSNRNQILNNRVGPNVRAEMIDIKEGTTGTIVRNNTFTSGSNLVVDSWVDVKGNNASVTNNTGYYASNSSFKVAVDVIVLMSGWGKNNIVSNNTGVRN